MSTTRLESSKPNLISGLWACALVLAATPLCVQANQFQEVMWLISPEHSIDMECKADLIKRYQPLATSSWVKDGLPVVPSGRVEVDNLGTLRIRHPTPADHGLYACRVSFWDTVVTTNEIRLHAGPPGRGLGESSIWIAQNNDIVGVTNVWAISIILSTVICIIWLLIVTCLRLKRSRCCGKSYELVATGS